MPIFSKKVNSLLVDLEKSSEEFWNIPREVAQILYFLSRNLRPKRILEIGTSNGYSGIWLAKSLIDNFSDFSIKGRLFTVESHAERFELAGNNFREAEVENVIERVKGHAPEVFLTDERIRDGGFDMMFFDATKKQHVEFLDNALGLLVNGGLLVVDNVLSHGEQMREFLEVAKNSSLLTGEVINVGDGLFVAIKKGG